MATSRHSDNFSRTNGSITELNVLKSIVVATAAVCLSSRATAIVNMRVIGGFSR
jgi:hypothetical protein